MECPVGPRSLTDARIAEGHRRCNELMTRSDPLEYTFTLRYALAASNRDPDALLERLCDADLRMPWKASGSPGGFRRPRRGAPG